MKHDFREPHTLLCGDSLTVEMGYCLFSMLKTLGDLEILADWFFFLTRKSNFIFLFVDK